MRGELHAAVNQQGGTAPVTARCTRSEGVQCLRIGCSTREHKPKCGLHAAARVRNQIENYIIRGVTRGQPAPHAANPHSHQHDGHPEACRVWPQSPQATEAQHQGTRPVPCGTKLALHAPSHRMCGTKLALHTPSHRICGTKLALHTPSHRICGTKLALHTPPHRICGTKLALLAQNGPFWRVFRMHGELCTAVASNKPSRANFFTRTPTTGPRRANFFAHRTPEGHRARLRCPWAAAGPGRASKRRATQQQPQRPHWCGGRRRDRRARAGFEARRRTK